jgi:hypothetical protein
VRTVLWVFLLASLFAGFFAAHAALSREPHVAPPQVESDGSELAGALGGVARAISGRDDVVVRCGDTGDPRILGTVSFYDGAPGNEAILAPSVCATLGTLRAGALPSLACTSLGAGQCPDAVVQLAWATSALAHESYHLAGIRDEAAAECYGLQSTALAAERLGAPPAYAARLGDYTFWNVRPPVDGGYFSSECRQGGGLDLHPDTPAWP